MGISPYFSHEPRFCWCGGKSFVASQRACHRKHQQQPKKEHQGWDVLNNIEQLNDTVAAYLKDYQTKKMSYNVYATSSEIMFEGKYTLLGYEVPLYIYFQPSRLNSGAIQLKVTSFSVGTLSLPKSEILKYIASSYKLPYFVEVLPDESAININIQNLKNDADIYLKATTVDLVGDQFNFDIYKKSR